MVFTEGSFEYEALEINLYECCPEKYVSLNWHFKVKKMWRFTPKGYEKNPSEVIPFQGKTFKVVNKNQLIILSSLIDQYC